MSERARQICPNCGSDDVVIGDVTSLCNACGEMFPTADETRRRLAEVVRLPIAPRATFGDPAWHEQLAREMAARADMANGAPARTRPIAIAKRTTG